MLEMRNYRRYLREMCEANRDDRAHSAQIKPLLISCVLVLLELRLEEARIDVFQNLRCCN